VTEFLVNGSLEDQLTRLLDKGKVLSLTRLVEYALQICQGVNWLHHIGIIHRFVVASPPRHSVRYLFALAICIYVYVSIIVI
jgi:serine/threonine protein kinase